MAYGFNDKKEKVNVYSTSETYNKTEVYNKDEVYPKTDVYNKTEVYSKAEAVPNADFVMIEAGASIDYNQSFTVGYTDAQLAEMGIDNMDNWMIVSVVSKNSQDNLWEGPHYISSSNLTRPMANYSETDGMLRIFLYNPYSLTKVVRFRVLLKKVRNL